ncbi:MAG: hypothetical protein AAGL17_14935 [Cyanobacteria bacterium J06576_12]
MTARTNAAALIYDGTRFEVVHLGMKPRDVISFIAYNVTRMVPFFLAWRWLQSPIHYREVLWALVVSGCIYALLALYEMRFSPQLNVMLYGFFPHDWLQHVRGGRFRPVVFLQHGLWLALFLFMVAISAFSLAQQSTGKAKVIALLPALWVTAVLLLSPNLGAAMLVCLFLPLLFLPRAIQIRAIWTVTFIFLVFPALRQAELIPTERFLSLVENVSEERAASLAFRFQNEDDLLARAANRPFFGWGGWGRWRVIDERGVDTTVADGLWIIILGSRGWIGYIGFFGILTVPLLLLVRASRQKEVPLTITTMGLILSANLIYLVPNSALSPISWLLGGSVAGFVSWRLKENRVTNPERAANLLPSSPYTRFSNGPSQDPSVVLRRSSTEQTSTK